MKSATIKNLAVSLAILGFFAIASFVYASSTTTTILDTPGVTENQYRFAELFATSTTDTTYSTTTTATSNAVYVHGSERVTFFFSRGGLFTANTGLSIFKVQVSPDGTDWYDYSRLYGTDVSKTATSTVTINAATSTVVYSMDTLESFYAVRCVVTETTDGEHGCAVGITF
jgi:hypothetical protein